MGLFDRLTCADQRFVCSEGHHLGHAEFQTKDLGCTMGHATIDEAGAFVYQPGGWGDPDPVLGMAPWPTIAIYCDCRQCPAFVQPGTGNLIDMWVQFDVKLADLAVKDNPDVYTGRVVSVLRTSEPTALWLSTEPLKPYMKGCAGPMPWAEAHEAHIEHFRKRIATTPGVVVDAPAGPLYVPRIRWDGAAVALERALEQARAAVHAMSPDEQVHMRHLQRISFAAGNVALSWPDRTPEEEAAAQAGGVENWTALQIALELVRKQAGDCPCAKCKAERGIVAQIETKWSPEDKEYVATVAAYPSLSWLAPTAAEAADGLCRLLFGPDKDSEPK